MRLLQDVDDSRALQGGIGEAQKPWLRSFSARGGDEVLVDAFDARKAFFIPINDSGCGIEYRLRGAVVTHEGDALRLRVLLRERHHVRDAGALEAVNGLVIVADHEHVRRLVHVHVRRERFEKSVLRTVQILELVDEHVLVALLERREHPVIIFQRLDDEQHHVVIVIDVLLTECSDVPFIDVRELAGLPHLPHVVFVRLALLVALLTGLLGGLQLFIPRVRAHAHIRGRHILLPQLRNAR